MSEAGTSSRAGWPTRAIALVLMVVSIGAGGCATSQREGLDVAQLPETVRPDYALFARRCSKCHSLARPLGSGITDDAVWIAYVDRMRRQPGSGISPQDAAPILRFLHYYSTEQRRIKREHDEANGGPAAPAYSDAASLPVSQTANRSDGNPEKVPEPSRDGLRSASRAPSNDSDGNPEKVPEPSRDGLRSASRAPSTR